MYQECRHIFTSGKKCQSPALKEQPFCYFHSNTRKQPRPANTPYDPYIDPKDTTLDLPSLEEADAIQLALSDVILALAANRIDPRRARILIYGLQVASQNNRHRAAIAAKEEAPAQKRSRSRDAHPASAKSSSAKPKPYMRSDSPKKKPGKNAKPKNPGKSRNQASSTSKPPPNLRSSFVILSGARSAQSKDPREQSSCEALRQQGLLFTLLIESLPGCPTSRRDVGVN